MVKERRAAEALRTGEWFRHDGQLHHVVATRRAGLEDHFVAVDVELYTGDGQRVRTCLWLPPDQVVEIVKGPGP